MLPRRLRSRVLFGALAVVLALALPSGAVAATAQPKTGLLVQSVDSRIGTDRGVAVELRCASATKCTGWTRVAVAGSTSTKKHFSIPSRERRTVTAVLSTKQYRSITSKARTARVQVRWAQRHSTVRSSVKLAAATASVSIVTDVVAPTSASTVSVTLSCAKTSTCTGTARLGVSGVLSSSTAYRIPAGGIRSIALPLTGAQSALVRAGSDTAATLRVVEVKPDRLAARSFALIVRTDPSPAVAASEAPVATPAPTVTPEPTSSPTTAPPSDAYANRNWTPTSYDTCSAQLHASYSVTGPDGKLYPTWHPAEVVDPATGKLCTFGHEHGADPATSDIAGWVADFFAPADGSGAHGLPFGYASEALDEHAQHSGMSMRHEDNAGHKVFVANNVALVSADHEFVTMPDGTTPIVCDYLIKLHQGSHSADATANNSHELIYAMRCTDGTEIIATTLSRIGSANEFNRSCSPATAVKTVSSTLPDGLGGTRLIPDRACIESGVLGNAAGKKSDIWSIYEVWQTANELTMADGTVVAKYDPWFGVRNPSRYYDAASSTPTANGIKRTLDAAWEAPYPAIGWPWSTVSDQAPFDYQDPRSPFDGARRDFYINQSTTANPGGGAIYTDPYGENGSREPFPGSIRQLVRTATAPLATPLQQRKFDIEADYGKDNGVHAPN